MYKQLVDQFVEKGYKWRIDGKLRYPTYDEIKDVLDQANEKLADGSIMQMGHLVIIKDGDHLDVYLDQGDYNDVAVH